MNKNYRKTVLQNLKKNYLFSLLNIIGLSMGIAICIVVVNFIITEYSFDHFHKKIDNIFNVYLDINATEGNSKVGRTSSGIGPAMLRELPEVNKFTRIVKSEITIVTNESGFKEKKVFWADSDFLDIFSFSLVKGDINTILKKPYTIIISESTAKKYFRNEDPLGKIVKVYDPSIGLHQNDFEVTGVFKDVPYNSHLQFDILLSYQTLIGINKEFYQEDHNATHLYTFVELKNSNNIEALRSKMKELTYKYTSFRDNNKMKVSYQILPYKKYHRTDMTFSLNHSFNKAQANLMLFFALIILVVAWINYINLSNVMSLERAKEVGIRKLLGSNKTDLILHFIFETFIINLIATFLAFLVVFLLKKYITGIIETDETFYSFNLAWFWIGVLLFNILSALLAGLYPAFVLSSFKPFVVLKGKFVGSKSGVLVKRVLIISQFAVAIALGIGTIVIHKQIKFAENFDKHIDINNIVAIESPQIVYKNSFGIFNNFKREILKFPFIESVTTCNFLPGEFPDDRGRVSKVTDKEKYVGVWNFLIGDDFYKTFRIRILAGNELSNYNSYSYKGKAMLNLPSVTKLEYAIPQNAVGELISFRGDTCNVVGIVDGYLQLKNMKAEAMPLPILFRSREEVFNWICFRYKVNSFSEVNKLVEKKFKESFPGAPYKYEVLTDYYNLQYKEQGRFLSIFKLFSIISIIVGLIGVIGLISYVLIQKSKQIGLRKVLGANIIRIMIVLYKELGYLLLIANIIAWPIIYFIMKGWLQNFPDRIAQNILWYVLISIFVLIIVIMSVFYQVLRISLLNPVGVLREE